MFTFVGKRPSLDLTATLQLRHQGAPVELLGSPSDLDLWAHQAGLVTEPMRVDSAGLDDIKSVREAIYASARAAACHHALPPERIARLNTAAAFPPLSIELTGASLQKYGNVSQLSSTLARDGLDMLGTAAVECIRVCASDDCTRVFLDTSRNGTRRWCGMRECGERIKSANYRRRARLAASD